MDHSMDHREGDTPRHNPGIIISDHYFKELGYTTFRSKGTDDWLITFTLSGRGIFTADEDIFVCRRGDMVLLPPKLQHHYYTPDNSVWEFVWAHFIPKPFWTHLFQLPQRLNGILTAHIDNPDIHERIRVTFDRIIRDSLEMNAHWQDLCLSALEEILLLVNRQLSDREQGPRDPRINTVLQIMALEMRNQHFIPDLARRVNLSASRLAHLFKEQLGESVIESLNNIRLRQAARYLQTTTESVVDIAKDVGFHDPFYFTKRFKARYGVSPLVYRKQSRKQER